MVQDEARVLRHDWLPAIAWVAGVSEEGRVRGKTETGEGTGTGTPTITIHFPPRFTPTTQVNPRGQHSSGAILPVCPVPWYRV